MATLSQMYDSAPGLRKNLPPLQSIESAMGPNEQAEALLIAMDGNPGLKSILVLTNLGIHIFKAGAIKSLKLGTGGEFFGFSTITGITTKKIPLNKWGISISRANNVDSFLQIDEDACADFYAKARKSMASAQAAPAGVTNVVQTESALDGLKKLKELFDLGVIDEAEFNAKKTDLMGRI